MKLLTFLGVSKYEETVYIWRDKEHLSRFAPVASCHFLQPDQLIVFLTEEAEQQVFEELKANLPKHLDIRPVPVPLGKDDHELWQIFDQVTGAVSAGEDVAFDITHGLRSFPLLGLLVAAFLRSGLEVNVRAVLYGAFDVRDQNTIPHRTPMFDLTTQLTLLEWAVAADRFNRTGDARYLASLVKNQQKDLAIKAGKNPELLDQIGRLSNLAGALTSISQSLQLIRPYQAMEQIAGLGERIEKAHPGLEMAAAARPFSLLLESIVNTYEPLAQADPLNVGNLHQTLLVERNMIHWYVERERWIQAVSLAREWLVSWVMIQLGMVNITKLSARHRIENVVGGEANDFLNAKQTGQTFTPVFLASLQNVENILSLWLELTDVRNDIDHAGMRENPRKPEDLIQQIELCIDKINHLPL